MFAFTRNIEYRLSAKHERHDGQGVQRLGPQSEDEFPHCEAADAKPEVDDPHDDAVDAQVTDAPDTGFG